ncbi:MAG: choice-of-anchor D domain-containing protein [Bacteroidota bacterium]|nr:choice-of-anchor D domain-containing protein [Bacteroidota bacterium]
MTKCKSFRVTALLTTVFIQATFVSHVFAQSKIESVTTYERGSTATGLGREYWFAMPQNFQSQGGKYYELFVISEKATTVSIQVMGGSTSKYPLSAGQVLNFFVPLAWEVTTSNAVEEKGIHVWSADADLSVYLLSRNPGSTDGFSVIPTSGWGQEYVVASFESLYEGSAGFTYDYPSEFCLVANQDNTVCTITPNSDIRGGSDASAIVHKVAVPFTQVLNRGECIQYKAVIAAGIDNFDLTGSVITSSHPVGVIGASECANIPAEFNYCSHICEMIPPVRTWGKTYYTIPFTRRIGGDTYLVIGTKAGQTINRNGDVHCVLHKKYEYYFHNDISDSSQWTSDAPFLLVQYLNSQTWPNMAGPNNLGSAGPSMVVMNPVEQYGNASFFTVPSFINGGYQNFVNVIVNTAVKGSTTFDGQPISSYRGSTQEPLPGSTHTAFIIRSVSPGKHEVRSDSGIGVYMYGYGSNDAYSWNGNLGITTLNDPDTIPPAAIISGSCFDGLVTISDRTIDPPSSRISSVKIDSISNMSYIPDPNYAEGIPSDSTFYRMHVMDSTKAAYLSVEAFDYAGNKTTVTTTYIPQTALIAPSPLDFGGVIVGAPSCLYATIRNTGKIPFSFQDISLRSGAHGFAIDSMGTDSTIKVGDSMRIRICFTPGTTQFESDTLTIRYACASQSIVVRGSGGELYFTLSDNDFKCIDTGKSKTDTLTIAENPTAFPITIDSIWVDDTVNFRYNGIPVPPFIINPESDVALMFTFTPKAVGNFVTKVHLRSKEAGTDSATVTGCGQLPAAVAGSGYESSLSKGSAEYAAISAQLDRGSQAALLPPKPNPILAGNAVRFVYGLSGSSPVDLEIYDVLGNSIGKVIHDDEEASGIYVAVFPVSSKILSGMYIYRFSAMGKVISGKLMIGQ